MWRYNLALTRRIFSSQHAALVRQYSAFRRLPRVATPVKDVSRLGFDGVPNTNNVTIQQYDPIATTILNEPTIIIERQIEMMNVVLGFEQANKYAIMDVMGNRIGYMQERDFGFFKAITRQIYRLHRPFTVDVFDNYGNVLMTIERPFSFINSHIKAILPDENRTLVGESVQNWHLWRRRYELFQREYENPSEFTQFGNIDAPFLSFEFPVMDENNKIIAGCDRNWVGIGRELFTDTGVYIVRFDSQQSFDGVYPQEMLSDKVLNYDQRAVMLSNAVSIDFDYFSRHSRYGGGLLSFGTYDE
ncbi:Aim25 [Kluyveromyces lactis]|nr:Aim25 [Kluyveromyces lactis]